MNQKTKKIFFLPLKWAEEKKQLVTFLSGGTNVLISDQGVQGLVMQLSKLKAIESWEEKGRLYIKALTGTPKASLMRVFAQYKLTPALFLCGLPGDVGGGVVMNAGVGQDIFPKEFKDIVDWVKVIPFLEKDKNKNKDKTEKPTTHLKAKASSDRTKMVLFKKEDIKWGYRFSQGWGPGLIYEVAFSWPLNLTGFEKGAAFEALSSYKVDIKQEKSSKTSSVNPLPDLPARLRDMALKRAKSQPLQSSSAGSVFKNPKTGEKAGALIESCGLKGHRIGLAQISEKHANFIVTREGAKAEDIHHLIQLMRDKVFKKHSILLEPEIHYIGRWP